MGRIADIEESQETIDGYSFRDEDNDLIVVRFDGDYLNISTDFTQEVITLSSEDAVKLIRTLKKTLQILYRDQDDTGD